LKRIALFTVAFIRIVHTAASQSSAVKSSTKCLCVRYVLGRTQL